jgi:maltose-binding protein MalE
VADVLLAPEGVLGFPLLLDPLVMYYNKNLLANEFILAPPESWSEYYDFSEQVTDAQSVTIDLATVALGAYDNITNAKAILSTLFLQTRNPITSLRGRQNIGTLINDFSTQRNFTAQVVNFYTSFTDPTLTHYSWNVGMPSDKQAFLAEDLAVYFGFASEAREFMRINPNINLGVAIMPQLDDQPKATFAKLQVVAINRQSRNAPLALQIAQQLTGTRFGVSLSRGLQLPPQTHNDALPPQSLWK